MADLLVNLVDLRLERFLFHSFFDGLQTTCTQFLKSTLVRLLEQLCSHQLLLGLFQFRGKLIESGERWHVYDGVRWVRLSVRFLSYPLTGK